MAVAYILTCLLILFWFRADLLTHLKLIISSAFDFRPALGGIAGYGVLSAIRAGFDRGLFATDSGLGLAPILHSSVRRPALIMIIVFLKVS